MINIEREPNSPASLTSPEIQKYIIDTQEYLTDPTGLERPKVPTTYRQSDLLEAFDRCFHQKCYLTEDLYANSWSMDVEHFIGRSENAALTYEWTNLYPAGHVYNNMKPRNTPPGGYLDPCNPVHDVETEILYSVGLRGENPDFEARDVGNIRAVNTCTLLNRLHKGHDENTKKTTAEIRFLIAKKYDLILNLIIEWQGAANDPATQHVLKKQLMAHLSRKSSFTMLMRSILAVRRNVPQELLD